MKYIVVGAGILGASTAYHLSKQGAEVTIVDRNDTGQATRAAAGIVCPWLTNRRNAAWYQLVLGGAKYYPSLIKELETDGEAETGYAKVGAINVFDTDKKLDRKLEIAWSRQKKHPEMGEVKRLTPEETKKLFPPLDEVYGAVYISGAARVNGQALKDALIRGAVKHGAKFMEGNASLVKEGAKVTGIQVKQQFLAADKVIVTGGIWAKELLEPLGMQFLVTPQKAQIVHLRMPETETGSWPVVLPPYNQYMLTFEGGKIVIGATQEDEAGEDPRVTVEGMHQVMDKALKVAPGLADATYVETKVGFRPFTPGYLPVIGPVPEIEGLFVANGLGASGLTSGPYVGEQLAKLVSGQGIELDLAEYDVASAFE